MKFEPGKVLEEFDLNGRTIRFRYPEKGDVKGLMKYINSMVENREYIGRQKPVTMQEEIKWLREVLKDMRKGRVVDIVVEMDGEIVGNSDVRRNPLDAAGKSGEITIGLLKKAQDKGIGTRLMKALLEQAKLLKLKVIEIDTFSINERARHVYEKTGFKSIGTIPHYYNHYGKYCDKIILYQEVPE